MASNDKEITRAIFNLVELGDFQALKRFTPSNFDWRQGNPEDQVPALHSAIVYGIVPRASSHADFLKIVSWMLQSGADPAQCVPSTVRATQEVATCKPPAAKAEVAYAGHAAFSLATKWLKTLRNLKGNWSNECEYLTGVMSLLTSSKDTRRPTVPVDLRFIDMWESVLDMTSTHNVTIETADGQAEVWPNSLQPASYGYRPKYAVSFSKKAKDIIFIQVLREYVKPDNTQTASIFRPHLLIYTHTHFVLPLTHLVLLVLEGNIGSTVHLGSCSGQSPGDSP
ncbi:unnamed protein product [Symbiodinium natans]|uniref:Uncharacterized protein n=1 Tax=Symbiodinium natans TaxID=878477 RepID=A0A812P5L0_9DINO|nr:unnamed protein product [Symbiodinium natans]